MARFFIYRLLLNNYSLDKIIVAINEFINELNNYRRNHIITMYDINYGKVKKLTI